LKQEEVMHLLECLYKLSSESSAEKKHQQRRNINCNPTAPNQRWTRT